MEREHRISCKHVIEVKSIPVVHVGKTMNCTGRVKNCVRYKESFSLLPSLIGLIISNDFANFFVVYFQLKSFKIITQKLYIVIFFHHFSRFYAFLFPVCVFLAQYDVLQYIHFISVSISDFYERIFFFSSRNADKLLNYHYKFTHETCARGIYFKV